MALSEMIVDKPLDSVPASAAPAAATADTAIQLIPFGSEPGKDTQETHDAHVCVPRECAAVIPTG